MNVQLKTDSKRAAILASTLQLINHHGFHGTPMSKIAKKAGVSTGIIYHYFPSKESLIVELYVSIREKMTEAVLKGDDESLPYKERFLAYWVNQCQFYIQHEGTLNFLEQYINSPFLKHYPEKDCNLFRMKIVEFYRSGIDKGYFKKLDYELLAPVIRGSIVAAAKHHLSGKYKFNKEGLHNMAMISWDGIKKNK